LTDGEAKQFLALMQKADVYRAAVFNGKDGGHEFSFTVSRFIKAACEFDR
jgi:hypothetical protein